MTRFSRFTLSLAVAGAVALGVSACSNDSMAGMEQDNAPPLSVPAGANYSMADLEFAIMMIPHHRQAVEMADMAASKAGDSEIKSLAAGIKAAQQSEIETMTGWLAEWKQPTTMPGGMNMGGMGSMPGMISMDDMTVLKAMSGKDFDRKFARLMADHHNGAIQMARDVQKNGSNADVKRFAAMIEQMQTVELAQLQEIPKRL